MKQAYLFTQNLTVGYGSTPLIDKIALSVRPGQIMTLIGPNGAGKSTILKTLARQLAPLGGAVWLDGQDMAPMPPQEKARRMALVLTHRVSPERMSCQEVVAMGRYPYTGRLGLLTAQDKQIVDQSLEKVGALALAQTDFNCLSDGQRQRILLARALCQQPRIILLDEPTSFLDIRHKLELLDLLKELVRGQELAVILSLHEIDLAQKISDLVVCVQEHAIGPCGPPEEIFTDQTIRELYGMTRGSYQSLFGSLELPAPQGSPGLFVIGGGGSGIPLYRKLQRQGVPFAAGILPQNDLDWPVAKALASCLVEETAYEPISSSTLEQARRVLAQCERVVCPLAAFGPLNEANRLLREEARGAGKLISCREL